MKLKVLSPKTRKALRKIWHPWFAWRPCRSVDENGDYIYYFCQRVLRRQVETRRFGEDIMTWEYKESEFDLLKDFK